MGDGACKKITISVFQSGKVLVTGATTFNQVNDAYHFICNVIIDNCKAIQWFAPILPSVAAATAAASAAAAAAATVG